MGLFDELKRRARHVLGPFLGIVVVAYFVYHTVHGERGVLAYVQMREHVADARGNLNRLQAEQKFWEHRVKLLYPASIDRDMLDERVRLMLGYARADDIVIIVDAVHTSEQIEGEPR
mgnify:FL=1|jgi:cell division protein FtsB